MKSACQDERRQRREMAPVVLAQERIVFSTYNDGAHLRVLVYRDKYINFWPGADKWQRLDGKYRHGMEGMIKYIREVRARRTEDVE